MQLFVVEVIKSVGFPIFVAAYLLVVFHRSVKENTRALRELKDYLYKSNHEGG